MKRILIVTTILLSQFFAFADCDLFKEETKVIEGKVKAMYKDMYEATEFVNTAKANKSEADNEKLGRYLTGIKKDLDLLEHGMSQLKLHQDCACPEFKFQFVDNLLVEVKFWLKKAQAYPLEKPKKTDYDGIKTNLSKSMSRATDLQVYFVDPCKESNKEEESKPDETKVVADVTNESKTDSLNVVDENRAVEQPKKESAEVMDTVRHKDVSVTDNQTQNGYDEEGSSTSSAGQENNAAKMAATAAGTAAAAAAIVNTDEKEANDSTDVTVEEAMAVLTEEPPTEEKVKEPTPPTVAMDTVRHTDVSEAVVAEKTENEKIPEASESSTDNQNSGSGIEPTNAASNTTGAAVAAGAAVAGTTAAIVAGSEKDKSEKVEKDNQAPSTSGQVMDTVRHTDQSTQTIEEAEIADNAETDEFKTETDKMEPVENTPNENAEIEAVALAAEAMDEELKKESQPVMDTVRHMDRSSEPIAESTDPVEPPVQAAPQPSPKAQAVAAPIAAPVPAPKPEPKTAPKTTAPISNNFHYAVQIATGNANTSEGKYAALGEEIYVVEEGGMKKYRVGKYADLNSAVNTKKKVFNNGFLDAFVVAYNNGQRISIPEAKAIENGQPIAASNSGSQNKKSTSSEKPVKVKRNAEVFLAVQVGASITTSDPIYEMVKYERKIGAEVKVLHGDPNRFYTGELKDKAAAENLLSRIKAAGVNDAFLIGVADGQRIEYQRALELLSQ